MFPCLGSDKHIANAFPSNLGSFNSAELAMFGCCTMWSVFGGVQGFQQTPPDRILMVYYKSPLTSIQPRRNVLPQTAYQIQYQVEVNFLL